MNIRRLVLIASLTLSGCGVNSTPTALPAAPPTSSPSPLTATFIPAPALEAIETPEPAEIDIREMSKITAVGELLGVEGIITNLRQPFCATAAATPLEIGDAPADFLSLLAGFGISLVRLTMLIGLPATITWNILKRTQRG